MHMYAMLRRARREAPSTATDAQALQPASCAKRQWSVSVSLFCREVNSQTPMQTSKQDRLRPLASIREHKSKCKRRQQGAQERFAAKQGQELAAQQPAVQGGPP